MHSLIECVHPNNADTLAEKRRAHEVKTKSILKSILFGATFFLTLE